ncbi:hypothetical protein V1527DRAFT_476232 [Lipomyces starkeyi]
MGCYRSQADGRQNVSGSEVLFSDWRLRRLSLGISAPSSQLKFSQKLRYFFNLMLVISGMSNWAPYNPSYFMPGSFVAFLFIFIFRSL